MDSSLWVGLVILAGFIVFFPYLPKIFKPTPKKCAVCGRPSLDKLIVLGYKTEGVFCRNHLMEKFQKLFTGFPHPMVVFHPEQTRKYCSTMYPFYPLNEMVPKFYFPKSSVKNMQRIITGIKGTCQDCGDKTATVAYFPLGKLVWNSTGPLIEAVNSTPEYFCTNCTYKKISPDLTSNKESYIDNGLLAPYSQSGVYVNTFI